MKYAIKGSGKTVDLEICDEIWGGSPCNAAYVRDALKAAPDATLIRVRFNSVGGDVDEGLDIYQSLVDHPARVEGYVTGLAASMASVILCACDYVRIAQSAEVMIHNPLVQNVTGNAKILTKIADSLDQKAKSLIAIYVGKTGKSESEIIDWLDAETYFDSTSAIAAGFADEIVKVKTAARDFRSLQIKSLKRPSESLLRAVAKAKISMDPQLLEALGLAADAAPEAVLAAITALKAAAAKAAEPAPKEEPPAEEEDPVAKAVSALPASAQAIIMGRLAAAAVATGATVTALLAKVPVQFKAWASKQDPGTIREFLKTAGISETSSQEPSGVRPSAVVETKTRVALSEEDYKAVAKATGKSVADLKKINEGGNK